MADELDKLDTPELRSECKRRGIHFPAGNPLAVSTKRECMEALRSPAYAEAQRLGLLTVEES